MTLHFYDETAEETENEPVLSQVTQEEIEYLESRGVELKDQKSLEKVHQKNMKNACEKGQLEAVESLIKTKEDLDWMNEDSGAAFGNACKYGHLAIAKKLFETCPIQQDLLLVPFLAKAAQHG